MKMICRVFGRVFLCSTMLFSSMVLAGENEHQVKALKIQGEGSEPLVMQFSTDESFSDLADGESRILDSNDGQTATITRNGDQMTINTSTGEQVTVPFIEGGNIHVSHHDEGEMEKHVRIIRKSPGESSNQIMIVAPDGLSDQEKQAIRDAMTAAGVDRELHFIGDEMHAEIDSKN